MLLYYTNYLKFIISFELFILYISFKQKGNLYGNEYHP